MTRQKKIINLKKIYSEQSELNLKMNLYKIQFLVVKYKFASSFFIKKYNIYYDS